MKRSYESESESEEWSSSESESEYRHFHHTSNKVISNQVYIRGSITSQRVDKLIGRLNTLQRKLGMLKFSMKVDPIIEIYIDTVGGELHPALKLYDYIRRSPIKCHTIIDGYCASAGTIIALAGYNRKITPSSFWMIHQLSFVAGGKLKRVKEELDNATRVQNKVKEIYQRHLTIPSNEIQKLLDCDKELDSREALRVGLCESLLE